MTHKIHDIGVAARIGTYSDCIEASPNQRWLFTSGTPGMDAAGELPGDITAQAELATRPRTNKSIFFMAALSS